MKTYARWFALAVSVSLSLPSFAIGTALAEDWRDKVVPSVLEQVDRGDAEFFLYLQEQADLSTSETLATKAEKGHFVFEQLLATARRSQPELISFLEEQEAEYKSFWVVNTLLVRGSYDLLAALAAREDVSFIYGNPKLSILPLVEAAKPALQYLRAVEPNLVLVRAPEIWAEGYRGAGAVIGIMDSGQDWDHPALISQYRGWNGSSADHNYNWHDSVHENIGAPCGPGSLEPCDNVGHGTAVTGIAVGYDGGVNEIGMAPEAKWIGCRVFDQWGSNSTFDTDMAVECFQWMLAPTDLNNENPEPSLAPHVVSNSWSCRPGYEGCDDPFVFEPIIGNLRSAGIVVVAAAGNAGPTCSSIGQTPTIYEDVITVGGTSYQSTEIAGFSGRGPVLVDGSGRLKPDLVAPASFIRSCLPGGAYGVAGAGTSFAAPHVAGLVALLVSADAGLAGQVDLLEQTFFETAVPKTTTQECGGIPGSHIPNNTYGYGFLDAYAAYLSLFPSSVQPVDGVRAGTLRLLANAPEPFSLNTAIGYELLDEALAVRLEIYDVKGRRVRVLEHSPKKAAGNYVVRWDGLDDRARPVPSGTYFYRLNAGGATQSRRMTLLK